MNDLDRAIKAVQRSRAAVPELYGQLTRGELWVLLPFHPELEGELEWKAGTPLPFSILEDNKGGVVPLFSSEERVNEGLEKAGVPPRTFCAASLPAIQILEILGKADLRAIINKSCATGELTLPPNLMRDLVSGKVLSPASTVSTGPQERGNIQAVNPADYPRHLVQPAFEFMRRFPNFRAAWIFTLPEQQATASKPPWQMLLLMQPRDNTASHQLDLVVQGARLQGETIALGLLDENDQDFLKRLFAFAPPFYRAG